MEQERSWEKLGDVGGGASHGVGKAAPVAPGLVGNVFFSHLSSWRVFGGLLQDPGDS